MDVFMDEKETLLLSLIKDAQGKIVNLHRDTSKLINEKKATSDMYLEVMLDLSAKFLGYTLTNFYMWEGLDKITDDYVLRKVTCYIKRSVDCAKIVSKTFDKDLFYAK